MLPMAAFYAKDNDTRYDEWIETNVIDPLGNCYKVCNAMHEVFPELILVRGWYWDDGKKKTHWWLEKETGTIIDPTINQFSTNNGKYEKYKIGI